jgi:4-hydroxybutyrate CoA-transferase
VDEPGPSVAALHQWRHEAARALIAGRREVVVISAMTPQQPDELLAAIISEARRASVRLRLLFADLTGALAFLDEGARADVAVGRIELVSLAGGVPRELSPFIAHYPNTLWDADRLIRQHGIHVDALVARVHATEDASVVSLGPMVAYTPSAMAAAALSVLEIAPAFIGPETVHVELGESDLTYPDDDYHLTTSTHSRPATEQQESIATLVAALIPDSATIQLGLGAVPEGVIPALSGKRDLGLHSGILPASLAPALESGAFTGAAKSTHRGRHVATGLMSPPGLGGRPWPSSVMLLPLSQTHAPDVLDAIDTLWAINSAFEIDLHGRVNAEYVQGFRIAAAGGQADFFRAAHASPHGASVLALPSRTSKGRPRVIAEIGHPVLTSTPPADVDFVVTEFGVAPLVGLTVHERAEALIGVAHPQDRVSLARALRDQSPTDGRHA